MGAGQGYEEAAKKLVASDEFKQLAPTTLLSEYMIQQAKRENKGDRK
jgi:hypothetical protein